MEGALSKWTNVMKGWQYRWFVLDDSAGIFSYYTSKGKTTERKYKGRDSNRCPLTRALCR